MLSTLMRKIAAAAGNGKSSYRCGFLASINRQIFASADVKKSYKLTNTIEDNINNLPSELVNQQKFKETTRALSILIPQDEKCDFMDIFPEIARSLTETVTEYKCPEAAKWIVRVLQYNVPHGKKTRGLLSVYAYKNLVKPDKLTPENMRLVHLLGWCLELMEAFFLVSDDMVDNSPTRRGQPCWHALDDVKTIAVNDVVILENAIYVILQEHFRHLSCYVGLLELFHQGSFITACGQAIDALNFKEHVTNYTMEMYKTIVISKCCYYSFYLPFAVAMQLASKHDVDALRECQAILFEIGYLFQVQDDFSDCFGNPKVTGKIGTDIQDNKCTWLAVTCIQRANAQQEVIMAECYGQSEPEKVARIIELYKELDLINVYANYEEQSYKKIKTHIEQMSCDVPQKIFLNLLNRIYKRNT